MLSILRLLSRTCGKKLLRMRKVALSRASFSCRDATHEASRAYRYPHLSEWVTVTQGVTFICPLIVQVIVLLFHSSNHCLMSLTPNPLSPYPLSPDCHFSHVAQASCRLLCFQTLLLLRLVSVVRCRPPSRLSS